VPVTATPSPSPSLTPSPSPEPPTPTPSLASATPSPTALPVAQFPVTGGPPGGESGSLAWLLVLAGIASLTIAGGLGLAAARERRLD
jgi:hypothetical protein